MSFDGFAFQISNAYFPRKVIQIAPNNVTISASQNMNHNGQKWTFWRVPSDGSYVIRNYTSRRFLGLLYHGKLVGVEEGAAIHWGIHPSGYDSSTWVIRMKGDSLDRALTLVGSDGAVALEYSYDDERMKPLQEWRLRETEYDWSNDGPIAEFMIEGEIVDL